MRIAFTAAALKTHFEAQPKSQVYDLQTRGLAAYKTSTGNITFFAHFRVGKTQVKTTLARLGEISVAEARAKVSALVVAGKENRDIIGDRKREAERAVTLGEVYALHRASMIRRNRSPLSVKVADGIFRLRLEKHANRTLSSISKADAKLWHSQWSTFGPSAANRAAKYCSVLWNFASNKTDAELGSNPFRAIDMAPEAMKRPVLDFDLLPQWWAALEGLQNPSHKAYQKLLLFSGLRREDAASILVSDIRANCIWRPSPKGGSSKAFSCPITIQLRQIIEEALAARALLKPNSIWLFPAAKGDGHLSGIGYTQVLNVSPHCLRRTWASAALAAGVDFSILKRCSIIREEASLR